MAVNALFNLKQIESQIIDIQDKYKDEIDRLLEIIYPPSDNENSDSGQFNDTSGTNNEHRSNESKESQYTRDVNYIKPGEEFMGNPPSIFLQTPSRKSRKSMTESIFHESDEEECDDKPNNMKEKSNTADEKTLNGLDMENDEEEKEMKRKILKRKNLRKKVQASFIPSPIQIKGNLRRKVAESPPIRICHIPTTRQCSDSF